MSGSPGKPAPERVEFRITICPDPVLREVLEDLGFTLLRDVRKWVRIVDTDDAEALEAVLRRRSVGFERRAVREGGKLEKWPRLSEELAIPDGGGEHHCGLCGKWADECYLYIECDDADSPDYPDPAKFHVCPACVRDKIDPHPRLYMRLE
jgi:hypothetical protein